MGLLSCFTLLLGRYTGQQDIPVGTPIAGRNREETLELIGFFVNTLVLRTELSGDVTFRQLLRRVRSVALDAFAHQDLPFEKLVEELQPERDSSRPPLFQVMLTLQNAPQDVFELKGLQASAMDSQPNGVKFDLSLSLGESAGEIRGAIEYSSDLFDRDTIARMSGHFERLVQAMVASSDARIMEVSLLTEQEWDQVTVGWNDTAVAYPADRCFHQLFEEQVRRLEEAVAVMHYDQQLSYGGLNRRANQLANYLIATGVGPEARVGVCLERGTDLLIGILGILKSGGAFVPVDADCPRARLNFILEDSGVSTVLAHQRLLSDISAANAQLICLDSDWHAIDLFPDQNPDVRMSAQNSAYVIYTSGTTGSPKGVVVEHHGISNLANWQAANFEITPMSRVSQFASFAFDAAVGETCMALSNGATLVMLDRDTVDPESLIQAINDEWINVMVLVPSMIKLLNPALLPDELNFTLVAVGEACDRDLALKWSVRCDFVNAYGPTEYTVYSHLWKVDKEEVTKTQAVPIGLPIFNSRSYILDSRLNPVPVGVKGEIYIAGPGVARGYLKRPDLTAARFIPNRFYSGIGYKDHGLIEIQSAWNQVADFRIRSCREPESSRLIARTGDLQATTIAELVDGMDPDLNDKTRAFIATYCQDGPAYAAFCRYLIEGVNNTYASCGIDGELLRVLLPFERLQGLSGLDLGFGNAEVMLTLKRMGACIKGLDLNPIFIQRARAAGLDARMTKVDVAPDLFPIESGIPAGSQDFVISTLLLDRLSQPRNFLENVFLVLKQGGRFAIQTLLPVVGSDDGDIQDPITYTAKENRIVPGEDAEQDRLALISLLNQLGGTGIQTYQFPYATTSRDGFQEYRAWSFTGRKYTSRMDAPAHCY
ncbi:MAG: amino acid adenylation domain-containing protein, partial [Blastocatellia bacterium]